MIRLGSVLVFAMTACAAAGALAFPLTSSLGNSGTREFHFCHLEVRARDAACAGVADCLQFDSAQGPLWLDVRRSTSPSESAPGTALLGDMFQYATQLSLVGAPTLIAQLQAAKASHVDLEGYWYPSGRRLLVLAVRALPLR